MRSGDSDRAGWGLWALRDRHCVLQYGRSWCPYAGLGGVLRLVPFLCGVAVPDAAGTLRQVDDKPHSLHYHHRAPAVAAAVLDKWVLDAEHGSGHVQQ